MDAVVIRTSQGKRKMDNKEIARKALKIAFEEDKIFTTNEDADLCGDILNVSIKLARASERKEKDD